MKKIIAFAGSNSKNSINKQLVEYTSSLINKANINILDLNDFELPLFGVDLETQIGGQPENAHKFLDIIKSSDGIILSLAEHNGAYSTAFKNLFDWMSRIDGKLWSEKPMLLMAASPGSRGGANVLSIAKGRFAFMGGNIVSEFSLPSFHDNFSEGKLINQELNNKLIEQVLIYKSNL